MISIVVALVLIGFMLYIIGLIPMEETIRKIVYAVVLLFVILWLLQTVAPSVVTIPIGLRR